MKMPPIHRLCGRFREPGLEREFLVENWSGLQLQAALTLIGFSLAWLASIAADLAYLPGTSWFLPVASARAVTGLFGLLAGSLLLRARLQAGSRILTGLVLTWSGLSALTATIIAGSYPLVQPDPESVSSVLVFTSFWMSIQVLGLGIALSHWTLAVRILAAAYLSAYLALAVYWSPRLPEPMIGTSILVVAACAFALILSALFSYRARHRFYLLRLYEAARQEAEKAQEFASFLLTATGHDIRQPVYALNLTAPILEEAIEAGDAVEAGRLARRQSEGLQHISRMLSSILELAHHDRSGAESMATRSAVADVFDRLGQVHRDTARDRGVALGFVDTGLSFDADAGLVEHILSNLVANAIQHSGGSKLLVGVRRRPGEVEFNVIDNGKGLSAAPVRMTGESVSDLPRNPSRRHSGLGLEIMFRLAAKGGLDLSLDSVPGRGVSARLTCPAVRN